jgi:hypothetical protein
LVIDATNNAARQAPRIGDGNSQLPAATSSTEAATVPRTRVWVSDH